MAVVTFGSICQQHHELIFSTGGKVLGARTSFPPSHLTPREGVPFVSELKVCSSQTGSRGKSGPSLTTGVLCSSCRRSVLAGKAVYRAQTRQGDLDLAQVTSEAELFPTVAFVVVSVEFGVGINNLSTYK